MKFLGSALVVLSALGQLTMSVDAMKNKGFDANFLKAMNNGYESSEYLKKVSNKERKDFWKRLLKKAKPAHVFYAEQKEKEQVEDHKKRKLQKQKEESKVDSETKTNKRTTERKTHRKLEDNDDGNYAAGNNNYGGYNGYNYNVNYNGNNMQNNNGQRYNNYNQYNGENGGQEWDYNQWKAQQYDYQGQYNYGNNNADYNYNGGQNMNNEEYYENYYQQQQVQDALYPGVDWNNLGFDMKAYSLKYTGCSAVKTYDDNKAADDSYDTVLTTKRFALFRLCPSNNCNKYSINGCGRNYGEYVLEMDSFLEGVVEFNRQRYWHYCSFCKRCNALEEFGRIMEEMDEDQLEFYQQMQEEAAEYYEEQKEQYEQEGQDYQNENAADYQYYQYANDDAAADADNQNNGNNQYYNGNNNNGNKNYNYNYNYAQNGNGNNQANNYQYNNAKNGYYYNQNNGNNNNNNNKNNGNNNNNGNRIRKLMVPKPLKERKAIAEAQRERKMKNKEDRKDRKLGYQNNYEYNYWYRYRNRDCEDDDEECQEAQNNWAEQDEEVDWDEYFENANQNMYNAFYWNEELYGEWQEDWQPWWLAFNWQVLPYCTANELMTCEDAQEMCMAYDEDFNEDADAMGGFSACTELDNGYYIGPHCNADGYGITLGVYSDEYCDVYVGDQISLYDVLGYNIDEEFDFFPQECVSCEEGVSVIITCYESIFYAKSS